MLTLYIFYISMFSQCGPGITVGIVNGYGLDGPGIESRWGRDFRPIQTGPGAHPASCTMGTGSFPGVKSGRGVLLTTHPLLAPRSWKIRAIPLPPLGHNRACNGVTMFSQFQINSTLQMSHFRVWSYNYYYKELRVQGNSTIKFCSLMFIYFPYAHIRNISRPRRVPLSAARGLSRRWTWRHLAEKVGISKGGGKAMATYP